MDELKKIFQEYYTLNDIAGILFWDNATYLPQNSSQSRSEQLAVLSKLTDKTLRNNNLDSIIANIDINNLSKYDKKNFVLMREIISQENSVDPLLKEKLIRKKNRIYWEKLMNSFFKIKFFKYLSRTQS